MRYKQAHARPARSRARVSVLAVAGASLAAGVASAQQDVEFERGIPVAPEGIADKPLPDGPFDYATAEGQDIRVTVVTKELAYPYAIEFLPDGTMLVTERRGTIRVIRGGELDPDPVEGGPDSFYTGESGLPGAVHGYMNLALHPEFDDNSLIYLSYTKPLDDDQTTVAIGRGRWDDGRLEDFEDVFVADAGSGGPLPIAFGQDGTLFASMSGGDAQDPSVHGGKVIRLDDDGGIPKDNPFVGREGYKPEIYSLGHRSTLGLAVHPGTGELWQTENGPNGGDEINVIEPTLNYGWPIVSLGRSYQGPWQSDHGRPIHDNFEPPIVYWTPAIAVSGIAFYTGDALPEWTGDVFVGGLRYGEIPGTGQLQRILFNQDMQELRREVLLADLRQRIRDVAQGPDDLLYVVTDEDEGAVLRIEPGI